MILLLGVTYRLWLPSAWTHTEYYPAIPLWDFPPLAVAAISYCLLPVIGLALTLILIGAQHASLWRGGWMIIALALALGFLTDQHRLQPWAYQSFLYACWFSLLPRRWWLPVLRTLTISIYFYSSIGKLDYQFLHTVGQEFLATVMNSVDTDISQWSEQGRLIAAAMFPLAELMIAVLLAIPRTRFAGGCLVMAMHAAVLVLLSPLGMNHSLGVLAWNAVLAGQAYWLFIHPVREPVAVSQTAEEAIPLRIPRLVLAAALLMLALTLPLSERRGGPGSHQWHWDHWLSWALYSPHNSRVQVEIHASAVDDLPIPIHTAVSEDHNGNSWHEFDLGKLSLHARGVPVLPQARYQLQLAIAIASQQGWSHQIRGVWRSASDRSSGRRTEWWLNRLDAMEQAAKEFP